MDACRAFTGTAAAPTRVDLADGWYLVKCIDAVASDQSTLSVDAGSPVPISNGCWNGVLVSAYESRLVYVPPLCSLYVTSTGFSRILFQQLRKAD
jgi:hypothetical protein